jgi:alginate O-acetyltransferase complex protein AlgI
VLFNSFEFIFIYLPVVLAVFFGIGRRSPRLAAAWLGLASIFFYGWWNPKFVLLLLGSIAVNYSAGRILARLADGRRAKTVLALAVTANLAVLGYFKYANFFLGTINDITGWRLPLANIILPLGISFFTFTQIAFLADVSRGLATEYSFTHYLLFVTYFPHLIAGPVLHHKQMMPQFQARATYGPDAGNLAAGLTFFTIGLAKKVLVADTLGQGTTAVFGAVEKGFSPQLAVAWIGALAYTLQLYFDFSGYSDMAIGISKLFNVDLPLNFNSPYKSRNIIEFWRRWHMTLSRFLRDYLYIPLGGGRRGTARRYLNLMITMLLGGLWHGANWTFVLWGGLHGLYLALNHGWNSIRGVSDREAVPPGGMRRIAATALTFVAVVAGWVVFRSPNLRSAAVMLRGMTLLNGVSLPTSARAFAPAFAWIHFNGLMQSDELSWGSARNALPVALPLALAAVWFLPNSQEIVLGERPIWKPSPAFGLLAGALFAACVIYVNRASEFLYFQF